MTSLRDEARALGALALPIAGGFLGNQAMALVDTAMVGRLGARPLAAAGIGGSLYFGVTVVGLGLVLALDPLVSQAVGAGEPRLARALLRAGIRLSLAVSIPLVALLLAVAFLLEPAGVDPDTARETRRFLLGRAPGMPLFLCFSAARAYLQATGRTSPILVATLVANALNASLNVALIWGVAPLGVPALGVLGSGISSTLATLGMLVIVSRGLRGGEGEGPGAPAPRALYGRLYRIGRPISVQLVAEVGAFTAAAILAGRLGDVAAGAHQVALTLASASFQLSLGVASATAVRVGVAVGRGDTPGARRAGFAGFGVGLVVMGASAALFAALPGPLVGLFTPDPDVRRVGVHLLYIAAVFQLSDGAQAIGAGALRGAGDTVAAQRMNLVGHYLFGIPVAVILGETLGWGAPGLWWGLSAGLTFVGVGLAWRFHVLSSREIHRA